MCASKASIPRWNQTEAFPVPLMLGERALPLRGDQLEWDVRRTLRGPLRFRLSCPESFGAPLATTKPVCSRRSGP